MAEIIDMALLMYANEPCRICGENITRLDVRTAVFAGYSSDNRARAAHKECWDKFPATNFAPLPRREWKHQ